MEENQNQNPEPNFNSTQNQNTNRKKTNPFKGFCIALLIVILICFIGLAIRMIVSGDGDYFAPIKKFFGISAESEEGQKKEK